MAGMKLKDAPKPEKGPTPIRMPMQKALIPGYAPSDDDARRQQSPDGPRAGYTVLPSGQRAFKDEIPFPPVPAVKAPYKVK